MSSLLTGISSYFFPSNSEDAAETSTREPPLDATSPSTQPNEQKLKNIESLRTYSLAEIAKHDNESSCWIIVHSKVYDVTSFIDEHPGGADILLQYAGGKDREECDWEFDEVGHSNDALRDMRRYLIGKVQE